MDADDPNIGGLYSQLIKIDADNHKTVITGSTPNMKVEISLQLWIVIIISALILISPIFFVLFGVILPKRKK